MPTLTIPDAPTHTAGNNGDHSACDESLELVLITALRRALTCPEPLPLLSSARHPGLFPRSRLGQQAAEFCRHQGWLRDAGSKQSGKTTIELFSVTESAVNWLLRKTDAATVLRALHERLTQFQKQWQAWAEVGQRAQAELEQLQQCVQRAIEELNAGTQCGSAVRNLAWLQARAWDYLRRWHETRPQEDCPLPALFRRLQQDCPQLSVGQFQDALRQWHSQGQIALHPWAGPIYEIPEPEFAFLVGHAIAYYVSLREFQTPTPATALFKKPCSEEIG